jgi:cis-3-alkyl-4-acyloxetan-2-one decarboxylase
MSADWRSLYPFQSHFLSLGEHRYHYVDEGPAARGDRPAQPLLFVHGNPTWSFYWRNLILGLRTDYRCLAVDHIGCGLSDKPQSYPYTLAQHTENLCRFIEQRDLRGITLLAHDWGGAIGLGAAVRLKERFAGLVLFNTAAFPPPFVPARIAACRTPLFGRAAVRGANVFARAALSMAVEKRERMTPAVRAGLLAPYDSWSNRVAVWRFVRDIPFTRRHPTHATLAELEQNLSSLADKPVAMIWGMRDWCFRPECMERLKQSFPAAETHELADCGHYVVEDAHERIVPIVREFVARRAVRETEHTG